MPFTNAADFLGRARERLLAPDALPGPVLRSDFDLSPEDAVRLPETPVRAAVLIGLMPRDDDLAVLLTLRPETMSRHAGQVAFPGGRVDAHDPSALAAALREAKEEVGVEPGEIEVIGQSDPYLTRTGFVVFPFVALLPPHFAPTPDPTEVADVFETPMSFLMRPENHQRHERMFANRLRAYYAMPHNGRYIWGATAGMIKALYERLYGDLERGPA